MLPLSPPCRTPAGIDHAAMVAALRGRYTKLSAGAGYLESDQVFPRDGTLIGAYIVAVDDGHVRVTDDGDTVFHAAVAGAEITRRRVGRYRAIAKRHGMVLDADGTLSTTCRVDELLAAIDRYLQAAQAMAQASLKHRPSGAFSISKEKP